MVALESFPPCPHCGGPVVQIGEEQSAALFCQRCQSGARLLAFAEFQREREDKLTERIDALEKALMDAATVIVAACGELQADNPELTRCFRWRVDAFLAIAHEELDPTRD